MEAAESNARQPCPAARLWALASPRAPGEYPAPWGAIAAGLLGRLAVAAVAEAAAAAEASAGGDYTSSAVLLLRRAPTLYRAFAEVRGLALSAAQKRPRPGVAPGETPGETPGEASGGALAEAPGEAPGEAPAEKHSLPGIPLVYDILTY